MPYSDSPVTLPVGEKQTGDQETGQYEKQIDASPPDAEDVEQRVMKLHHHQDCDAAQQIELGNACSATEL